MSKERKKSWGNKRKRTVTQDFMRSTLPLAPFVYSRLTFLSILVLFLPWATCRKGEPGVVTRNPMRDEDSRSAECPNREPDTPTLTSRFRMQPNDRRYCLYKHKYSYINILYEIVVKVSDEINLYSIRRVYFWLFFFFFKVCFLLFYISDKNKRY